MDTETTGPTYETIKATRKSGGKPTLEQYQQALEHQRLVVQQTAVEEATLSGENHARHYLPNCDPEISTKYYDAQRRGSKARTHLSKLVFWAAKAQAEALGIAPIAALAHYAHQSYKPASINELDGEESDDDESEEDDDDDGDDEDGEYEDNY